jgi:hypothetical protein
VQGADQQVEVFIKRGLRPGVKRNGMLFASSGGYLRHENCFEAAKIPESRTVQRQWRYLCAAF